MAAGGAGGGLGCRDRAPFRAVAARRMDAAGTGQTMTDQHAAKPASQTVRNLDPVNADEPEVHDARWTGRLLIFLRVMAVLSMAKGLYHWAIVAGVIGPQDGFEYQPMPWQTATVFF